MREAAVIGSPISHSRSPAIFSFLATQLNQVDFRYHARDVSPPALAAFIAEVRASSSWVGLNVTSPHKEAVFVQVDSLSDEASAVGAINALRVDDGKLRGFNTDVTGFLRTLEEQGCALAGRDCVLWGVGGAACAAGYALGQLGARNVFVMPAVGTRRGRLAERFASRFPSTSFVPVEPGAELPPISLFINATPIGMTGVERTRDGRPASEVFEALSRLKTERNALAFDLVYEPMMTPFLERARARGIRPVGGLAMLVDQALATWELWFGVIPAARRPTVRRALRRHLHATRVARSETPIFVSGFMGVGKSTIGAALAQQLDWRFVDSDRPLEVDRAARRTVISLGDGSLQTPGTLEHLLRNGRLVNLSARANTLAERLAPAIETRPLLLGLGGATLRDKLEELLTSRDEAHGAAVVQVATDDQTPEQVLDTVLGRLAEAL